MSRAIVLATVLAFLAFASLPATAQTAPGAAEINAFQGLHRAAHVNDVGAIGRLAASGADVNARVRGRTPVHVAAFASNEAALDALARAGADMNALDGDAYDAVTIAAVANDVELMSRALALGNSAGNVTSRYDGTALIAAAHLGHAEVVRRLIEAGAPLNHVNNLGWTALIEAVILGDGGPNHVATVRALVEAGANRSIADRQGATPLMHAKARGYAAIQRLIEAAGR
jgi:ankyrin repeat protein